MSWNLEEALLYYKTQGAPDDQNALIALLKEVQQEQGGSIPAYILPMVAEYYGIREALLQAIIRRVPRLRLSDKHTLELCGGPNCSRRAKLAEYAEKARASDPKSFDLRIVPCMRLCGKGPNIRWDGKLYHNADETLLKKLIGGEQV